jgi:hypothetical protein
MQQNHAHDPLVEVLSQNDHPPASSSAFWQFSHHNSEVWHSARSIAHTKPTIRSSVSPRRWLYTTQIIVVKSATGGQSGTLTQSQVSVRDNNKMTIVRTPLSTFSIYVRTDDAGLPEGDEAGADHGLDGQPLHVITPLVGRSVRLVVVVVLHPVPRVHLKGHNHVITPRHHSTSSLHVITPLIGRSVRLVVVVVLHPVPRVAPERSQPRQHSTSSLHVITPLIGRSVRLVVVVVLHPVPRVPPERSQPRHHSTSSLHVITPRHHASHWQECPPGCSSGTAPCAAGHLKGYNHVITPRHHSTSSRLSLAGVSAWL